ncbi:MAG: LysR substrate-binding domain-containing protein, partial [Pseudomonadota bacterium]
LGRAEIDVALTYDLEIPKDVAFEELVSLPPSVMLPADHPLAARETVALEELAREPMVLLDLPLSRDYFLAVFHDHGLQPDIAERTTDLSVARSLVANGFGFGLMNMRMRTDLAPDGARLATRSISGAVRPLGLGLASKRAERRPRILSAFFEHMRARAAAQDLPGVCSENSDGARP